MGGQNNYLPSDPFMLLVSYGEHTERGGVTITRTQQHNFDDIGIATARMNEALGWRGVVGVDLVVILKRVRKPGKRSWGTDTPPPPVERRPLP